MKRWIIIAILLGVFCNLGHAVIHFNITAPQDEPSTRAWACNQDEAKSLQTNYLNFIKSHLWPLKFSEMEKLFGPKLETATNWWGTGTNALSERSGPDLSHHPVDCVLPVLVGGGGIGVTMMVSGLHSGDPTKDKS